MVTPVSARSLLLAMDSIWKLSPLLLATKPKHEADAHRKLDESSPVTHQQAPL